MKTQINHLIKISFLAVFAILSLTVSAQSYYTPGQVYTFRNKINVSQTLKVDIVFDAAGNASVSKSMVSPQANDKYNSFVFCDENRIDYSSESKCINFNGDLSNFLVIDLETIVDGSSPLGGGVCLTCPCSKPFKDVVGKGECKVTYTKENSSFSFNCEVTATCEECGKLTISSNTGTTSTNQILIIQTNSVNFN